MSRHRAFRMNHHPHLEEPFPYHLHHDRVPAAVGSAPAAVRGTLKAECLSITTFCANMTPTLWLWLLPPLLPSWIPVITRRGSSIGLLGRQSLLRIGTVLLVTLVSTARVGLTLVEGLRGVWLARLLAVWLRATRVVAIRCGVGRWLVGTRWRGGRGWGDTERVIPG
jgi:hypothetical protein